MRIATYVIVAMGLAVGSPLRSVAQSATPESIAAAIARGAKSKEAEYARGESGGPAARAYGFTATMTGPLNRISNAAAEASRNGLTFTSDSVFSALSAPAILIEVIPKAPTVNDGAMVVPPTPKNLVLRARATGADKAPPIQPDSVQIFPAEWFAASGEKFVARGIRAFFNPASLPRRDFDVLVVTAKTEEPILITRDMVRRVR